MKKRLARRFGNFINKYFVGSLTFLIVDIAIIFMVPPSNLLIILFVLSLALVSIYLFVVFFIDWKTSALISFFAFFVLLMKALGVFNGFNLLLLISLIAACSYIVHYSNQWYNLACWKSSPIRPFFTVWLKQWFLFSPG